MGSSAQRAGSSKGRDEDVLHQPHGSFLNSIPSLHPLGQAVKVLGHCDHRAKTITEPETALTNLEESAMAAKSLQNQTSRWQIPWEMADEIKGKSMGREGDEDEGFPNADLLEGLRKQRQQLTAQEVQTDSAHRITESARLEKTFTIIILRSF